MSDGLYVRLSRKCGSSRVSGRKNCCIRRKSTKYLFLLNMAKAWIGEHQKRVRLREGILFRTERANGRQCHFARVP
jgi:hypothetical protein